MIEFTLPLDLVSPNVQEHWTKKAKRNKRNEWTLKCYWMNNVENTVLIRLPCVVTITRLSPRQWDEDNFIFACKGLRDSIADLLRPGLLPGRADDDHNLIEWRYGQEKGKIKQVKITIDQKILEPVIY